MAPSAARAIATVVAEVCDMHSSSPHSDAVLYRMNDLYDQLEGVLAGSPDAETVSAVDRAIEAGARQLAALGTRLAAVVRRGNAATVTVVKQQFSAACTLAATLGVFAAKYRLIRASPALCGCVTLPLECGHAPMTMAAVRGSETARHIFILEDQSRLLDVLIYLNLKLNLNASEATGHQALAAQLAPEPLLAWLSAAASTTLALRDRGPPPMVVLCFANLLNIFVNSDSKLSRMHALALQRNIALQRSLVQVLVFALHAAAVAMQLPPDHRPCDVDWRTIIHVVHALMSASLADQFSKHLASSAGTSTVAQRVQQSTSQLIAAAPASCSDELPSSHFAALWHNLAALLGLACSIQQQQGGAAVPDAQRQKTARLLLQALSRLPTALQVAVERGQQDAADGAQAETLMLMWRKLLSLMHELKVQEPWLSADDRPAAANGVCSYHTIDSLADVPAWCSAGTALLRALPHATTLVVLAQQQQLAGQQPSTVTVPISPLGISMCTVASSIVDEVARYCASVGSGGPWSAADAAAAGEALWQLHTALCRCIHSVAAGSLRMAAIPVGLPSLVLNAAACVSAAMPATADGTAAGGARHLLAMSVAQAEAVLAAASLHTAPADEHMAAALLSAIRHGPVALAGSPPMRQELQGLAQRLGVADEGSAAAALHAEFAAMLQRDPQPGDALELAQAAATRSCAYLRCANLAGEGGPASGPGTGSWRCSKCQVAWYCGTACSHADWRAGHRRMCGALGAARAAVRERQREEV